MKPNNIIPPFNFDAIPLYFEPSLWDETKPLRYRGFKFVVLYTLSIGVHSLLIFAIGVLIRSFRDFKPIEGLGIWWLLVSVLAGILMGLLGWWDFTRTCKKLATEAGFGRQKQSE